MSRRPRGRKERKRSAVICYFRSFRRVDRVWPLVLRRRITVSVVDHKRVELERLVAEWAVGEESRLVPGRGRELEAGGVVGPRPASREMAAMVSMLNGGLVVRMEL